MASNAGKEEGALATKVWIRSDTLGTASALPAAQENGRSETTPIRAGWTLARLLSGNAEVDPHTKDSQAGIVVKIEDNRSAYNGQTIDIPPALFFLVAQINKNGAAKKSALSKSMPAQFGSSFAPRSMKPSAVAPTKASANKIEAPIPNICMANPSDVNFYGATEVVLPPPPHDLQSLNHLHEASVLHTLERRYDQDMIYTSTGSHILIALNPFKATDLYEEGVLEKYAELGEWEQKFGQVRKSIDISNSSSSLKPLPPHVFRIADTAFRTMIDCIRSKAINNAGLGISTDPLASVSYNSSGIITNQSLLVSGESGAGKTVTTKHILRYLASLSQRRGDQGRVAKPPSLRNLVKAPSSREVHSNTPSCRGSALARRPSVRRGSGLSFVGLESKPTMEKQASWMLGSQIEVKILEANPILEAFGNARTIRNDNSSRFGKYIELLFSQKGSLIGATIETYLLEKVRLIHCETGERNYHIFYEIMEGASEEELQEYLLDGYQKEDFKIMNQSGTVDRRDGVGDQEEFDSLIESMTTLQFDPAHIKNIMNVTCACIHGLNLTLKQPSDDESDLDDSNPHLTKFLTLLGIERDHLRDTICFSEFLVGGKDIQRRNQSKANAEKGMEAFIKTLYSALFSHLVDALNERISFHSKDSKVLSHAASIGILDIFGFESFETNSFEQLCINYCNEALQQVFNGVVFKRIKEEYDQEGIDSSFIEFPDNQDALDIIDKRGSSVLSILDDMTFAPATNDDKFATNLYQKMDQNLSTRFSASFMQKAKKQFVINHYAGPVEYNIVTFLEKNKEEVPRAMVKLLKSSSNEFVNTLALFLDEKDAPDPSTKGSLNSSINRKKKPTIAKNFCAQLKKLRSKIGTTTPYFVRCIKPNQELIPSNFSHDVVVDQLKSLGVLEAVRVSRLGFGKSYSHEEFFRRYRMLALNGTRVASESESALNICRVILKESLPRLTSFFVKEEGEKGIQIGLTKVFLRQQQSDGLEWLRNNIMTEAAITTQKVVRVKLSRNELLRRRKEKYAIKIQSCARRFIATRDVQILVLQIHYATVIQAHHRGSVQRVQYKVLLYEKRKDAEERKRSKDEEEKMLLYEKGQADALAAKEADERKRRKDEDETTKAIEEAMLLQEKRLAETLAAKEANERKRRKAEEEAAKRKLEEELGSLPKELVAQDSISRDAVTQRLSSSSRKENQRKSQFTLSRFLTSRFLTGSKLQSSTKALLKRRSSTRIRASMASISESKTGNVETANSLDKNATPFPSASTSDSGFYDVEIPVTEHGLLLNITSYNSGAMFVGYRQLPSGEAGPAEQNNLMRRRGDKIVSVNGEECDGKSFGEVIGLLVTASAEKKGCCQLRMQDWRKVHYEM